MWGCWTQWGERSQFQPSPREANVIEEVLELDQLGDGRMYSEEQPSDSHRIMQPHLALTVTKGKEYAECGSRR